MSKAVSYAITLHRPWPYAVFHLGKDIENRSWPCWLRRGIPLAIHAGKKWDESGAEFIRQTGFDLPPRADHPAGIVGVVTFRQLVESSASPWFVGPYGWELCDPVALSEVISCPGRQGLWKLSDLQSKELSRAVSGAPLR